MPTIGIAEVLVKPSFDGVQKSVGQQLDGIATTEGSRAGKKMGSRLGSGLKTGALIAGGAAIAGLGLALTKGFGRLSAIEDAKAKLTGLGNSAADVQKIMDNALASVKGTAFGMDEAATVAATAVAAGIKPGKELERTLKLTGDAATIAGVGFADMGSIFSKVASSNKIQGDTIAQLNDMGIPIVQLLGKELGTTAEETIKLASKGKIGFATFQKAMEAGLGGAALKSGNTTAGAFKNMGAAVSRFGAMLLKDLFPLIGPIFNSLTKWIDLATAKMQPLVKVFSTELIGGLRAFGAAWKANDGDVTSSGFPGFMERAAYIGRQMFDELRGGIIAFAAAWKYNDGEITSVGFPGFMEHAGFIAHQVFDEMKDGIVAFAAAWKYNDGDITSSGFPGFMERAAYFTHQLVDAAQQLDFTSFQGFLDSLKVAGGTAGGAFASIGTSLTTLAPAFQEFGRQLPKITGALVKLAAVGLDVVVKGLAFLADNVDTIIAWMPLIVAGFVAWRLASKGLADAQLAVRAGQVAMTPVTTVNNVLRLIAINQERQLALATGGTTRAILAETAAQNGGIFARGRAIAGLAAQKVATLAASAATKAAAIAQRVLNIAMRANPIGLLIGAITALVGGLIWFFTQTELGKQIIGNVWSFIQTVVGGVVSWFQTVALPIIQGVFTTVGAVFSWLYNNIIKPVFDGVMVVVNAAWLVIRGIFQVLVSVMQNIVAPAFQWLYNNIVKPVFAAIGAVIGWYWNNVLKPIFDTIVWIFRNVLGPAFNWLYQNVIKPAFDGIGKAVKWVWDNVLKPVFDFIGKAINQDMPKAFELGVAAVKKIWQTIQDIAKAPVKFVVETVINKGLIGGLNGIGHLFGLPEIQPIQLGFMNGGYTGNGGKDEPAGIVHGGEFVFTKEQTKRAGVSNLYAMADALAGYSGGGFVNPLKSMMLTQGYNRIHKGIDLAAGVGTPVFATESGRVSWSGPGVQAPGVWGGNEIHIDGKSGVQEWFAHLSSMAVRVGDMVRQGQQIGLSGNTGITSGPHLHFGTFAGGWPNDINPLGLLSGAGVPSGGGFNPLAGIIDGLLSNFRNAFPAAGFIADVAMGIGKKLFSVVTNLITGGNGSAAGPALYDLGGILPPGVSQVVNRTGKPEAILNPQQWADISRLAAQPAMSSTNSLDGATLMMQFGSELLLAKVVHKGVHEATRGRKGIL